MSRARAAIPLRALAGCMALVVLTGACGRGSATEGVSAGKLGDLAAARGVESRKFTWSASVAGRTVSVEGVVEDDYRYQGTVKLDDTSVWEEVVIDDARYLRVLKPDALLEAELITELAAGGGAGSALMAGEWVRDKRGAPAEFGESPQQIPLDPQLVLDAARRLDRVSDVIRLGGYKEYNTLAADYLPKNDKFPEHKDDGVRFDHIPVAFNPNVLYTRLDDARRYFEFASIWATLEGVNRIEQLTVLPKPTDGRYEELYDQLTRVGNRRLSVLLDAIKAAPDSEVLRTLSQTYVVQPAEGATVAAPSDAVDGDLVNLLSELRNRIGSRPDPGPLFGPVG